MHVSARPGQAFAAALMTLALLAPCALSAQVSNTLNLGFSGGTWSGEDYLNTGAGVGADASFQFGVGESFRVGPVFDYGNFAIGDTGERIEEFDFGVEGRFIDFSGRWAVDPFIGVRGNYSRQSADFDGVIAEANGLSALAMAGFYFPFGTGSTLGDLSFGVKGLALQDWEVDSQAVADSGGTSVYWFIRVGVAFQFGT